MKATKKTRSPASAASGLAAAGILYFASAVTFVVLFQKGYFEKHSEIVQKAETFYYPLGYFKRHNRVFGNFFAFCVRLFAPDYGCGID